MHPFLQWKCAGGRKTGFLTSSWKPAAPRWEVFAPTAALAQKNVLDGQTAVYHTDYPVFVLKNTNRRGK